MRNYKEVAALRVERYLGCHSTAPAVVDLSSSQQQRCCNPYYTVVEKLCVAVYISSASESVRDCAARAIASLAPNLELGNKYSYSSHHSENSLRAAISLPIAQQLARQFVCPLRSLQIRKSECFCEPFTGLVKERGRYCGRLHYLRARTSSTDRSGWERVSVGRDITIVMEIGTTRIQRATTGTVVEAM